MGGSLAYLSPHRRPPQRPLERHIGLSRSQRNVPQLLSTIGSVHRTSAKPPESKTTTPKEKGKSTEDSRPKLKERRDTNTIVNKPLAKLAMADVDPEAPPMSSDEDETPCRADIPKTDFGSKKKPDPSSQITTRQKRQAAQGTRTSVRSKSSQISQPSSSAPRELPDNESDPDELPDPERNRKRKSPDIAELSNHFNKNDIFRTTQHGTASYVRRTIKVPKSYPRREENSPKKSFRALSEDPLAKKQSASPRRKFHAPPPNKSLPTTGSPDKKRFKRSLAPEELKVESPEEERRKFIIPELYSLNFDMKEEDDDKAETTVISIIDRHSESPAPLRTSSKSLCSMCNEEVDEEVRKIFDEKHPDLRFTLRREQKFCLFHKRRSARKTWKVKGYPEINWNRLDKRIAARHNFLQAILEGGQSHYGDIFKDSVKSGQNRTLLKSETNITPGYYGIRGLRVMTDNLTYKFSRLLRERAVQDRLISARGHTAYLQTVLVPELAVQLIKEDMSVSEEKARMIMEESTTVGELLNEEVKDVVLESEDEQDEEDEKEEKDEKDDKDDKDGKDGKGGKGDLSEDDSDFSNLEDF